jgi:hypothetical protein
MEITLLSCIIQYDSQNTNIYFCENTPLSGRNTLRALGGVSADAPDLAVLSRIGVLPNLLVSHTYPLTPQFSFARGASGRALIPKEAFGWPLLLSRGTREERFSSQRALGGAAVLDCAGRRVRGSERGRRNRPAPLGMTI